MGYAFRVERVDDVVCVTLLKLKDILEVTRLRWFDSMIIICKLLKTSCSRINTDTSLRRKHDIV
jgi:hypothetical protein